MEDEQYGLELTRNSKVGWAFSLARNKSCIGKTDLCARLCYANGIRYATAPQQAKRERNYRTCALILEKGGPELLAENLVALVDQARPIDWLAAQLTGRLTMVPWTVRLQDCGDFFSPEYVQAWYLAARSRPQCDFWFYTRSFVDADILAALTQLAALPNCQGWLSADRENYSSAISAYLTAPSVWKVALLQDQPGQMPQEMIEALVQAIPAARILNFPCHSSGRHVTPVDDFFVCPQVLGVYKLETQSQAVKPCQLCSHCLPG